MRRAPNFDNFMVFSSALVFSFGNNDFGSWPFLNDPDVCSNQMTNVKIWWDFQTLHYFQSICHCDSNLVHNRKILSDLTTFRRSSSVFTFIYLFLSKWCRHGNEIRGYCQIYIPMHMNLLQVEISQFKI